MAGIRQAVGRRVGPLLRSRNGILSLLICILFGTLILKYLSRLILMHLPDIQYGEDFFLDEEDYLAEYISQLSARPAPDEDSKDFIVRNEESIQKNWQLVSDTRDEMHVYSAFYDANFRTLRIIAVINRHESDHVECRFSDKAINFMGRSDAIIRRIREARQYPYSAAFILCPMPDEVKRTYKDGTFKLPSYVSIASTKFRNTSPTSNILEILYPIQSRESKFSICVQPTYGYDNAVKFIEWIEVHRSLGVEQFTLYNTSIGPHISCVINEYNNQIRLESQEFGDISIKVLPWGDPSENVRFDVTIKQQNQLAALNDCIYRHRGKSDYILSVDLDEFIFPHRKGDKSYEVLMKGLRVLSGERHIGLYKFRSAFFSPTLVSENEQDSDITESLKTENNAGRDGMDEQELEWSAMQSNVSTKLVTLQLTLRQAEPFTYDDRTKYICIPERLVEAGIHHTWEMLEGYGTLNVPPEIGLVHHYRSWGHPSDEIAAAVDKTAREFSVASGIADAVAETFHAFRDTCDLVLS